MSTYQSKYTGEEIDARLTAIETALQSLSVTAVSTAVDIFSEDMNGNQLSQAKIPAATETRAGVMSAADKAELDGLIDKIYHVGAIYISLDPTDPGTFLGGTWEQIKDKFLLAASETYQAGAVGGSADAVVVSHTHTQAAHSHGTGDTSHKNFPASSATIYNDNAALMSGSGQTYPYSKGDSTWANRTATSSVTPKINSAGEDGTGKNMPPYLAVYMWKRTA